MSRVLQTESPTPLAAGQRAVRGVRLLSVLGIWLQRRRTRHQLSGLDAHLLADIGITEAMARKEAARRFWQG